jgi:hypothetical protein
MYIYIYMYVCIYVYIYVCVNAYVYVYVYVTHIYIYEYAYVYVYETNFIWCLGCLWCVWKCSTFQATMLIGTWWSTPAFWAPKWFDPRGSRIVVNIVQTKTSCNPLPYTTNNPYIPSLLYTEYIYIHIRNKQHKHFSELDVDFLN